MPEATSSILLAISEMDFALADWFRLCMRHPRERFVTDSTPIAASDFSPANRRLARHRRSVSLSNAGASADLVLMMRRERAGSGERRVTPSALTGYAPGLSVTAGDVKG